MYGEFYISELISRHPDSERVLLVCEVRDIHCFLRIHRARARKGSGELSTNRIS
jgi:hypothetical protein